MSKEDTAWECADEWRTKALLYRQALEVIHRAKGAGDWVGCSPLEWCAGIAGDVLERALDKRSPND